ncbi:MAG: hypothetical protein EPN43_13905 [Jatrophihabitans sp.]|nr:MAG: hypothetical protein EPN43_13905 [Jatrophihabitans sp.]
MVRRVPARVAAGAFLLNSGIGKLGADDDTAKRVHGVGSGAYPVLAKVPAPVFVKALGATEAGLGGALLTPFLRARTVGLALTAFAGGLLGIYWRTPGLHRQDNPRPTPQGVALAKDSWLFALGAGLLVDGLTERRPSRRRRRRATASAS